MSYRTDIMLCLACVCSLTLWLVWIKSAINGHQCQQAMSRGDDTDEYRSVDVQQYFDVNVYQFRCVTVDHRIDLFHMFLLSPSSHTKVMQALQVCDYCCML